MMRCGSRKAISQSGDLLLPGSALCTAQGLSTLSPFVFIYRVVHGNRMGLKKTLFNVNNCYLYIHEGNIVAFKNKNTLIVFLLKNYITQMTTVITNTHAQSFLKKKSLPNI